MPDPVPPGDNVPLIEGLDPSWNDIVQYVPEDKRAEFTPKFQQQISKFDDFKQWEDFQKSGITAEQATTALNMFNIIENNPQQAYEIIGKHLGITPAQAQQVVDDLEDDDTDGSQELDDIFNDPRFKTLAQKNEAMAQILLQRHQDEQKAQAIQKAEDELDQQIKSVLDKNGNDIPEEEILMRMAHYGMNAQEAYDHAANRASEYRRRPPAPKLLGQGGSVPANRIDPTKLGNKDVKNLVAQMMQQGTAEN